MTSWDLAYRCLIQQPTTNLGHNSSRSSIYLQDMLRRSKGSRTVRSAYWSRYVGSFHPFFCCCCFSIILYRHTLTMTRAFGARYKKGDECRPNYKRRLHNGPRANAMREAVVASEARIGARIIILSRPWSTMRNLAEMTKIEEFRSHRTKTRRKEGMNKISFLHVDT
jgi:hypothetical protein